MMSDKKYFVHESSVVDEDVQIGENTKIWHFCHIQKGATIGKNCSMGQNVNISNNVKIGNGVKIQNNVSVYEGVEERIIELQNKKKILSDNLIEGNNNSETLSNLSENDIRNLLSLGNE